MEKPQDAKPLAPDPAAATDRPSDPYERTIGISREDIGPLAGAILCLAMMVAIAYYVFFQPSPFEQWVARFDDKPAAAASHKPDPNAMMPAGVVGEPDPGASPSAESAERPEKP